MKRLLPLCLLLVLGAPAKAAFIDVFLPGSNFVFGSLTVLGNGLFGPGDTLYFEPLSGAYTNPAGTTWRSRFFAREAGTQTLDMLPGLGDFASEAAAFNALRAGWNADPNQFSMTLLGQTQIELYVDTDQLTAPTNTGGLNLRIHVNTIGTPQSVPEPGLVLLVVLALAAAFFVAPRRRRGLYA